MKIFRNRFRTGVATLAALGAGLCAQAQIEPRSWVDSVARYGMERFLPADEYKWDWGQATLLNSVVHLYREAAPDRRKPYLDYVRTAMNRTLPVANGKHPNAVASAHGMAFLAGVLKDPVYKEKTKAIYTDYLLAPRASNGGVSHRAETVEFWDDTIYMLGMFFFELYRQTGDERYIEAFMEQYYAHQQKLSDPKTGLWVHGWDADDEDYDDRCSQPGWPDRTTRRSHEVWGRGNGWIVMALADGLNTVPRNSRHWKEMAGELKRMVAVLPSLQDGETGMWYQLPLRAGEEGNFLESSCTAMFGYGMVLGMKYGVLKKKTYKPVVDRIYEGLRRHAMVREGGAYLAPDRVCLGTCIGDKEYYFKRKVGQGVNYAIGAYVMFGLEYEKFCGLR